MSYHGYEQGQQGYGQYNPYGQQGNPYGQQGGNPYGQPQSNPYGQQGNPYQAQGNQYDNRPGLQQQSSSRYDEESQQGGYEMTPMNTSDPNRILNECRDIDSAIQDLESRQQRLKALQKQRASDPNVNANSPIVREVESVSADILQSYRQLVARTKRLKSDKESGNPRNSAQVGRLDRKLKASMNQYQQLDRDFRKDMQDQIRRQYLVVRPDASESEVQEVVEDSSNTQIFSQTLMQSDRRGQAQNTLSVVQDRHKAIQKIEQDMMQIAALFNDLDALVVQQEAPVARIEEQGEVVTEQVAKANTELDGAVKKARAARKKKWMCLGIAVAIIVVLAIIGAVVGKILSDRNKK